MQVKFFEVVHAGLKLREHRIVKTNRESFQKILSVKRG